MENVGERNPQRRRTTHKRLSETTSLQEKTLDKNPGEKPPSEQRHAADA